MSQGCGSQEGFLEEVGWSLAPFSEGPVTSQGERKNPRDLPGLRLQWSQEPTASGDEKLPPSELEAGGGWGVMPLRFRSCLD